MLVAGGKKHAKEVLQISETNHINSSVVFYDDVSLDL
jgi:hypothetical protein